MSLFVYTLTEANVRDVLADHNIPNESIISLMTPDAARGFATQLTAAAEANGLVAVVATEDKDKL